MPQMVAIEKSKLLQIADLLQQVSVLARAIVEEEEDTDQSWYFAPQWQAWEDLSDEDIMVDRVESFDTPKKLVASLHA